MPRQNRVNPFGELIATPARGRFMGNRGVLHDDAGRLTAKRWSHNHWITCLLEFGDSKVNPKQLMAPGSYTELFFLDEATALAAGHRPCAECRWDDFKSFKRAWIDGNLIVGLDRFVGVNTIDQVLHRERVTRDREKVMYQAKLGELPDGVFVALACTPDEAHLLWEGQLFCWSPEGYADNVKADVSKTVQVLTPASTVKAIQAGYRPQVLVEK